MEIRTLSELVEFRRVIQSTMDAESGSGSSEERINDVINAIQKLPLTKQIIQDADILRPLMSVKQKYAETAVGAAAKKLLVSWKKSFLSDNGNGSNSSRAESAAQAKQISQSVSIGSGLGDETPRTASSSHISRSITETDITWGDEEHYRRLNTTRKNVMDQISEALKLSTIESMAKFIAFNIETALNESFPESSDRNYTAKARTIAFNLKKNEKLRSQVLEGLITANELVHMNAKDMANDALREARQKAVEESNEARRGDVYEVARQKIKQDIGINPEGGEFKCNKCKSTKTTHYAMQTRSSDEPMTIFVCCLNCGKRWRE